MSGSASVGTLERRLAELAAAGIGLRPGAAIDAVRAEIGDDEVPPDEIILCVLGSPGWSEDDGAERPPLSPDVLHLDTECIDGDGAYVAVARAFAGLAAPDRLFDTVADRVDIAAGEAWVEFVQDGRTERFVPRIDADWLDGRFVSALQARLARTGPRRFALLGLDQDFLAVCKTPEAIRELNGRTGLAFELVG